MLADRAAVSAAAADLVVATSAARPDSVLGLAAGATMTPVYRYLVERHRRRVVTLEAARAFLLDEYLGLPADDPMRFRNVLARQLVDHVDLMADRVTAPDVDDIDPVRASASYEARIAAAGGVDLQLLGVGRNGHVGFNEPGSSFDSRTRVVALSDETRRANWLDRDPDGPTHAITMGIGTILDARHLVMVATGVTKAPAVARAVAGAIAEDCPATALRRHPQCTVLVDAAAASELRRDAIGT